MVEDIRLEQCSKGRRIVIDTKFTSLLKKALNSQNLNQLYAYLRTQENKDDLLSKISYGILLYSAIEENIDELFSFKVIA